MGACGAARQVTVIKGETVKTTIEWFSVPRIRSTLCAFIQSLCVRQHLI